MSMMASGNSNASWIGWILTGVLAASGFAALAGAQQASSLWKRTHPGMPGDARSTPSRPSTYTHHPEGASTSSGGELPVLVFTAATLDFGTVDVGSPGGPLLPAVLTNESETVTATSLSFDSDVADILPQVNPPVEEAPADRCALPSGEEQEPWSLPPGTSCMVMLNFVPPVAGPVTGSLTVTSAEGAEASMTLSGIGGDQVMLYGQSHQWYSMPWFSGWLNASFTETPSYNSEVSDDFIVADPEGWTIDKVGMEIVWGFSFFPDRGEIPDIPVDVHFVFDEGGVPGEELACSATGSEFAYWEPPRGGNRVEIVLSSPCTLSPGHYWLRVDLGLDNFSDGDWLGWGVQYVENPGDPLPPVNLNHPVWRNSGGEIGVCPDWTPLLYPNCGIEEGARAVYGAIFWLIGQGAPAGVAELSFDPTILDFGEVEVGTTSPPLLAMLQNTGDFALTGLDFSMDGGEFEADTVDCATMLGVGESCQISFTCTPVEPEPASGIFDVSSDQGAQATLDLSCEGAAEEPVFTPMSLEVDPEPFVADGNGVFEPGELVEVAPAWRTDNLFMEPLTGTVSSFGGADGAVYFLALGDADYGNVEPATTSSCRDAGVCYWLAVNDPATRPATHWEASFEETVADETTHTWSLHIGDSFTDVPRSSPFYTSIETLLHHGVTGGCTDTEYCPGGTNTRGQMAVFLLKATEGGDYVPSACVESEQLFADVPFDSPLCPWIEELAESGVTAGCGDGNYCPGAPVSRAQMAVFLLKAFEGDGYTPPECTDAFTDVTCPSPFAAWVEELAARGITSGCAGDPPAYCPATPVTRAQMAVFVTETFGLTLYGP